MEEESQIVIHGESLPCGCYVQMLDGSLKTISALSSSDQIQGIYIGLAIDNGITHAYVVHPRFMLTNVTYPFFNSSNEIADKILNDRDSALNDYSGYQNCETIKKTYGNEALAVYACENTIFPDGKRGYLPSMAELYGIYTYTSEIEYVLNLLNLSSASVLSILMREYWLSTAYSVTSYYTLAGGRNVYPYSYNTSRYVIPVTTWH